MKVKKKHAIIGTSLVLAVLALYFIVTGITGQQVAVVGKYDEFAKCLTENGVVMYGTSYCGACKAQKELFGDSFKFVTYVECTETNLCTEKGIRAVPTWEINGIFYTGGRSLEDISELCGCPLE